MSLLAPPNPDAATSLMLAVVDSSSAPILLLDADLNVVAASASFYLAFDLEAMRTLGRPLSEVGGGEWAKPQLGSLLRATVSGFSTIPSYEMDISRSNGDPRTLVLAVHKLDYGAGEDIRVMVTIVDVTDARRAERVKDDLLREKAILLHELQHRIANSLQIISSILLQSARQVQSEETRSHLYQAHSRVQSVAEVQKHLADTSSGSVELRPYLTGLCRSIADSMIRDPAQLSVSVAVDDAVANGAVSVSLGLIVTELMINALKHAFPEQRKGRITVEYHAKGADWTLSVSDDGIGMPKAEEGRKPGLGTGIIEALAKQLDAEIEVTDAHPGTLVSVRALSHAKARPVLRAV